MRFVGYNAVSIICIVAAFALALFGKDGWGWFMLIAVLLAVSPGASDVEDDPEEDDPEEDDDPGGGIEEKPSGDAGNVVPIRRSWT